MREVPTTGVWFQRRIAKGHILLLLLAACSCHCRTVTLSNRLLSNAIGACCNPHLEQRIELVPQLVLLLCGDLKVNLAAAAAATDSVSKSTQKQVQADSCGVSPGESPNTAA
jgi:uracil-DNA glycosylase